MNTVDFSEIDRYLQARIADLGFAATVKPDPATSARIAIEASTWHEGSQQRYQSSYGVAEVLREGVHSIVDRFVHEARRNLPSGTRQPR